MAESSNLPPVHFIVCVSACLSPQLSCHLCSSICPSKKPIWESFWYFLMSQVFGKSNTNTNTHTRTRERKVRARFTFHGINHFDLLRSNMELLGMATWSAKPMIRYPATQAQTNTHIKHPLYMMHLVTPWWVCRHARKKDQNLVWTLQ